MADPADRSALLDRAMIHIPSEAVTAIIDRSALGLAEESNPFWPQAWEAFPGEVGGFDHVPVYSGPDAGERAHRDADDAFEVTMIPDWKQTACNAADLLTDRKFVALLAMETTQCCGRATKITVGDLDDKKRHVFDLTPPPGSCPSGARHPRAFFEEKEFPQVAHRIAAVLQRKAEVLVWGPAAVLTLYAELKIARDAGRVKHDFQYWPVSSWTDVQAMDARWRMGWSATATDLTHLPYGVTTREAIAIMSERLQEIADSRHQPSQLDQPIPERHPLGAPVGTGAPLLLPIPLALLAGSEARTGVQPHDLAFDGPTDLQRITTVRAEQQLLRHRKFGNSSMITCDLCGRSLPRSRVSTAHIKPRSHTTDGRERLDLHNIMGACLLGCDILFEHGDVFVGADGVIGARSRADDDLAAAVAALTGRRCTAHDDSSEPYFRYHRDLPRTVTQN